MATTNKPIPTSEMMMLALAIENQDKIQINNQGGKLIIDFAQKQDYPLTYASLHHIINKHGQIGIKPLPTAQDEQRLYAFMFQGVVLNLYAQSDYQLQPINPNQITRVLRETGLPPTVYFDGRKMGDVLHRIDKVEHFLKIKKRDRDFKKEHGYELTKALVIALAAKESGVEMTREMRNFAKQYEKELDYIIKPVEAKTEQLKDDLKEMGIDEKAFSKDLTGIVKSAISNEDALMKMLDVGNIFRLPELPPPELLLEIQKQLKPPVEPTLTMKA